MNETTLSRFRIYIGITRHSLSALGYGTAVVLYQVPVLGVVLQAGVAHHHHRRRLPHPRLPRPAQALRAPHRHRLLFNNLSGCLRRGRFLGRAPWQCRCTVLALFPLFRPPQLTRSIKLVAVGESRRWEVFDLPASHSSHLDLPPRCWLPPSGVRSHSCLPAHSLLSPYARLLFPASPGVRVP